LPGLKDFANYSAKSFVKVGSVENLNYKIAAIEEECDRKVEEFAMRKPTPDHWGTYSYMSDEDGLF
jgi:hypothetical protein